MEVDIIGGEQEPRVCGFFVAAVDLVGPCGAFRLHHQHLRVGHEQGVELFFISLFNRNLLKKLCE